MLSVEFSDNCKVPENQIVVRSRLSNNLPFRKAQLSCVCPSYLNPQYYSIVTDGTRIVLHYRTCSEQTIGS